MCCRRASCLEHCPGPGGHGQGDKLLLQATAAGGGQVQELLLVQVLGESGTTIGGTKTEVRIYSQGLAQWLKVGRFDVASLTT